MTERREICLDQNDTIAAAQVLAWIARPHRPESGVRLLNEWWLALERRRGEDISDAPFKVDKPNRLEKRIATFTHHLEQAFIAADWFNLLHVGIERQRRGNNFGFTNHTIDFRATKQTGGRTDLIGNARRDIWRRRKPLAHMCLAVKHGLEPIARDRREAGCDPYTLFEAYMRPTWLVDAIDNAERYAFTADEMGIAPLCEFVRFYR